MTAAGRRVCRVKSNATLSLHLRTRAPSFLTRYSHSAITHASVRVGSLCAMAVHRVAALGRTGCEAGRPGGLQGYE